eukprot:gene10088-2256_t
MARITHQLEVYIGLQSSLKFQDIFAIMSQFKTKFAQKVLLTLDSWQQGVSDSNFVSTGKISAKEFLEAGDYLVTNFPSWSWSSGKSENRRAHLPEDKQFLISKNVPCFPREERELMEENVKLDDADAEGDSWVQANLVGENEASAVVTHLDDEEERGHFQTDLDDADAEADLDNVPTLSDDDIEIFAATYYEDALETDEAASSYQTDNIRRLRTYDISIHYDGHYSTPRVWLFGYDPDGKPLTGDQWKQDFSPDHVDKTVTYERHPHLGYYCPSIHPCKHAEGMKRTVQLLDGDNATVHPK